MTWLSESLTNSLPSPWSRLRKAGAKNVAFNLATPEMETKFLEEAEAADLYALHGHRELGGVRASMYNAMPYEGADALGAFMEEFERRNG